MIMGLERLDRITAFMEEQSGPMRPVEFPPPRHPGPPSTIREEQETASSTADTPNRREQNGGAQPSSSGEAPEQDGGLRPESSAASRERLSSSLGAGTSADGMSGRDRVNAAIASLEIREEAAHKAPTLERKNSQTESLDGEVCSIVLFEWCKSPQQCQDTPSPLPGASLCRYVALYSVLSLERVMWTQCKM